MKMLDKKSAEEVCVQLSDGRLMSLEDVVKGYERLLRWKSPRPGKWFLIDIDVIEKNIEEINCECGEKRDREGRLYRERFREAREIADREPNRYPRQIWTFIFKHEWMKGKTEQEMRDMCLKRGEMCDEVIGDLELQMRICNGESGYDLFEEPDTLPYLRMIQLRNGGTGLLGGGTVGNIDYPPADIRRYKFNPDGQMGAFTPYAFKKEPFITLN